MTLFLLFKLRKCKFVFSFDVLAYSNFHCWFLKTIRLSHVLNRMINDELKVVGVEFHSYNRKGK